MKTAKFVVFFLLLCLIVTLLGSDFPAAAAIKSSEFFGAAKFHAASQLTFVNSSDRIENHDSVAGWFTSELNLPQGSNVRKIKLFTYDNSAGENCLTIGRVDLRTATRVKMGFVCSTGSSTTTPRVFATTTIYPRKIDNKNYVYYIYTKLDPGGSDLAFWGAQVIYVK
ncbi:MAG: hypothetical protein OEY93_00255 [Anaerolineae bacterium]|nr:hypothetical protein [Anaerolineae bacterium]